MTTLVGLRRRGYTPESIRLFCDRIGVAKAAQWIDMGVLEQAVRDDLEARAGRVSVVSRSAQAGDHQPRRRGDANPARPRSIPHHPERGVRRFHLGRELWIEREDFSEDPPKGFFRLAPDRMVRLRYGYVVKCTGFDRDADGRVSTVYCEHLPDTRSGTPGADSVKVKGNIHWVSAGEAVAVELRIYDRLFTDPAAGCRRPRLPCRLESGVEADLHRLRRAFDRSTPRPNSACSSSGKAITLPTATTTAPGDRSSTGSPRSRTPPASGAEAKSGPGARIQRLAASG